MSDHYGARRVERDSHDLSLSPRDVTRDSLVNNMLMSLDQLSVGPLSTNSPLAFDSHGFDNPNTWAAAASVGNLARPPDHQYSYSSDFEAADDSSRMSSQTSRGRRSNSSSNFQSGFSRLNSVREAIGSSRMHSRGRKGSKSSSSASIEAAYTQAIGAQRWGRGGVNRSASFDNGLHRPPQYPPFIPHSSSFQMESQHSNFSASDDYDAAPMPTIPGGPRRIPSASPIVSSPRPPPEPTELNGHDRKRSISRSVKSSAGRAPTNTLEAAPAMPPLDLDSAPAPHVAYEKSKDASQSNSAAGTVPAQPKERAGFFRRVLFGSGFSRNDSSHANSGPATSVSRNTKQNNDDQTSQTKPISTPSSRDTSSSHSNHPVLQKKTSSFFRRRKKSFHEEAPPLPTAAPAPPVPSLAPVSKQPELENIPPPSPVSSLRQVMDPYLHGSPAKPGNTKTSPLHEQATPSKTEGERDREAFKREFSPDYEPSPNARIRTVDPEKEDDKRPYETPSRPAPQRPTASSGRKANTFLNLDGASDSEEPPTKSPKPILPRLDTDAPLGGTHRSQRNDDTIRASDRYKLDFKQETEDDRNQSNLALPIEGARAASPTSTSTSTDYKSAPSAPPSVRVNMSNQPSPKIPEISKSMAGTSLDEPDFVIGDPTDDDRQKAQNIFDGNDDFISKEKAAAWMGEEGSVRQRTLQAYMELYDFAEQNVVQALRQVCGRLILRAETQQVDRLLVAFAKRWCQCNPNHGFQATDIIHTICYSIMLLNTDLHVADIDQKMTRSQFVKNTMTTIIQALDESAPNAFPRPTILEKSCSPASDNTASPYLASPYAATPASDRRPFRNSFLAPTNLPDMDECGPLVKIPFNGTRRAWEEQVEVVLKSFYASIRDERLPLFGNDPEKHLMVDSPATGLSVMGLLKRTPSVLSKAPSESQLSTRGRIAENSRNAANRWNSKSRSRPGVGRTAFSSSHTSFDDDSSLWSPALSSATWSRISLGRTQTSVSQDSLGSGMYRNEFQKSIGFANALSQAIIRDEDAQALDGAPSLANLDMSAKQLLEDESLELAGPPWMKEGIVMHKHHLDGVDKKAKERSWSEVFAVVQKGQMTLFSFNASKSLRHKSRTRNPAQGSAPVGGGNWQSNATTVGSFGLRQTLASALPSPGYSPTRPHVWALSLPTGAVHLFQAGTPEIIKEFVNTVNYWSARLSTHPLVGGISNIEYGWSEAIVNNALVAAINESSTQTTNGRSSRPGSSAATGRRSSIHSGSLRSFSFDQGPGGFTNNSGRGKLPGDRVHIADWTSPTQSLRASTLTEKEQMAMLSAYVKSIEDDLQAHNQLRSPMLLAFTPRGSNAIKAMANWERKSAYLLRESVKYRTYVDCLQNADSRKQEIYSERDLARRAARGEVSDGEMEVDGGEEDADETLRP
ncbi:hypothetical protein S40285_02128 [Stachybotrys chlorohalonatus IBT 40285]|uniref:SEC7 domain-containing protein n=1 Tax=Stachybotrys chlorohalonatus (strain IBT 40285) TaxID=1283841 RepID=A0A084QDH6_STAC4|nr:hypothetical protein S40285_02128 [Stachybotrys chlorohalonata IBT 40285]